MTLVMSIMAGVTINTISSYLGKA